MFTFKVGSFKLWVTTEVFWSGSVPEYFECLLTEYKPSFPEIPYYVHINKDNRFPMVDMKYMPEEKNLSAVEYKIKQTEFNSYQHRKDMTMPMWKLHATTVEKIISHLAEMK